MSFDIMFHTCNLGTKTKSATNPFTREKMMAFDDPGLTKQEKAAVLNLLKTVHAEGPDDFGGYYLTFADGGEAELSAEGLLGGKMEGCGVQTHQLTPKVAEFLFQLSDAGGMIITPIMEGAESFVTNPERLARVKQRFPSTRLLETKEQLQKLLEKGFAAFKKYRKQVTRGK